MVAKATPWGRTINAPVRPATRSSRRLARVTSGHQSRKGNKRASGPAGIFIGGGGRTSASCRDGGEAMNISRQRCSPGPVSSVVVDASGCCVKPASRLREAQHGRWLPRDGIAVAVRSASRAGRNSLDQGQADACAGAFRAAVVALEDPGEASAASMPLPLSVTAKLPRVEGDRNPRRRGYGPRRCAPGWRAPWRTRPAGPGARAPAASFAHQAGAARGGQRAIAFGAVVRDASSIAASRRARASRFAGQQQERRDQFGHFRRRAFDAGHPLALRRLQRRILGEDVGRAADHGQRCAQFMAGIAGEAAFALDEFRPAGPGSGRTHVPARRSRRPAWRRRNGRPVAAGVRGRRRSPPAPVR
jgi:hypothetical protein